MGNHLRFVVMLAGGALCWWTLRRYLAMLNFAQHAAERSVCGKCGAYSAIAPTGTSPAVEDERDGPQTVRVRCRKCGNEWITG